MQRRSFSGALLGSATLASIGSAWPVLAQTQALREGTDYRRLSTPAPVDAPAGKIEVVEFFAYTCIHCFNFEPLLSSWMKTVPSHVSVRRVPVRFNASFEPLQKLYYTLETLGLLDRLHDKAFEAIHKERQRLNSADAIVQWAVGQGVDKAQFNQVFNSFAIAGKANRAAQLQDAYAVEGTPALGVAGRFYVPGQGPRTLTIANALIEQARKG